MFTYSRKPFLVGFLVILAAGIVAITAVLMIPSPAPATPTITWTPSSLTEDIGRDETKTVSVSMTSSDVVNDVTVQVVPELQAFITVNPSTFANIGEGQTLNLSVTFFVPTDTPFEIFEGTIQVRRGKAILAKPLPVRINVLPISSEETINEFARRLRDSDTIAARQLIIGSERKLAKLETLSQSQLDNLADFYLNGVLIEEINDVRVYRSFLREPDGSISEVTFRMERNEVGHWRFSW